MTDGIQVTVRLYSILRHRDGDIVDRLELDLPPASTVLDVLTRLDIPLDLEVVLALNDKVVPLDTPLSEGDLLALIPAVAGG
jgi:molybdopterin converting factor small subunit